MYIAIQIFRKRIVYNQRNVSLKRLVAIDNRLLADCLSQNAFIVQLNVVIHVHAICTSYKKHIQTELMIFMNVLFSHPNVLLSRWFEKHEIA